MVRVRVIVGLACLGLLAVPAGARAQGLVGLMYNTFLDQVVLSRTPGGTGVIAHEPVFANDPTVTNVTDLVQQVSRRIASQVSLFPIGSSSGGFTYRFDPALGTFDRTSQSFGPAFAERALTIGRGRANFGMNYQHATYSSLDGRSLEDADIQFFLLHQPLPASSTSYVDGDVIEAALELKLSSDTIVFFGNVGVTDRFDLGVALPIQHVKMELTYHASILDFASGDSLPATHVFAGGSKVADFGTEGSATGIGDIVVRGKLNLVDRGASAAALAVDLRLPTGDEDDMLGSGGAQAQIYLIGSGQAGRLSPHVNVGFTLAGGGSTSNQFNYVGGTEVVLSPRATLVADLVGRTFFDTSRLVDIDQPHAFQRSPTGPVVTTTLDAVGTESGTVTSILGTMGVKLSPSPNLLVSAHVLFSLNDGGLRTKFAPVFGFDFSF